MSNIADKIQKWGRRDVTRWLERRNLAKFGPLFLRNGIVGSDLVQSRLTFLYKEQVTLEDRERLLAELYLLLHSGPAETQGRGHGLDSLSGSGSTAALTPSISMPLPLTPQDQIKYQAVLQVANSLPGSEVATPIVVVSHRRDRPPPAAAVSATTLNLLASKTRSRSESRLQTMEARVASPSPGRKYLKRKSTPAVHDYLQRGIVQNSSLFDTLFDDDQVILHCVRVQRSEAGARFGFSYQTMADSCLLVTGVTSPDVPLQPGDRLLEVNGILLPRHDHSSLDNVLDKSAVLNLVIVRPHHGGPEVTPSAAGPAVRDPRQANEKAVMQEVRWQALRHLLKQLQHTAFDPLTLTGQLKHVENLEDIKGRARLETELEEAQRVNTQLWDKITSLQAALKIKEDDLQRTREEKVQSLTALRSCLVRQMSRHAPSNIIPTAGHPDSSKSDSRSGENVSHDVTQTGNVSPDVTKTELQPAADDEDEDLEAMFSLQAEADLARLESPEVTKAEVLQALWEHSRASQRHVRLVDRLISLVAERAPWMLAELEQLEELEEEEEDGELSELPEALQDATGDGCAPDQPQSRTAEGGSGCTGEDSADPSLDADGGGDGGRGGQPCTPSPARGKSPNPKLELRERVLPRAGDHHHHQQLQQHQQRPVPNKAVSWQLQGSREPAEQHRTHQQRAAQSLQQQQKCMQLPEENSSVSVARESSDLETASGNRQTSGLSCGAAVAKRDAPSAVAKSPPDPPTAAPRRTGMTGTTTSLTTKAAEVTPAARKVLAEMTASDFAAASSSEDPTVSRRSATSPGSLLPPLTVDIGVGGSGPALSSSSACASANAPCSPRPSSSPRSTSNATARRFAKQQDAEENDLDLEQAILV